MQPQEPPVVPKEYAGLWIAWSSDHQRIVASGKTWKEARAAAIAAGEPGAYLTKAPKPNVRFVGGFSAVPLRGV